MRPGTVLALSRHIFITNEERRAAVPGRPAHRRPRPTELARATLRRQTAKANDTRLAGLRARGITAQRDSDEAQRERMNAEAVVREAQSARDAAELVRARVGIKAR